jgi:hypothetical protein
MTIPTVELTLDASHRYWLDGRELISVTTALRRAGLVDAAWFTPEATLRGTYVHEACALIDDDALGSFDPALSAYLAAYETFLRDVQPEWAYIEHRVCDVARGYAGTLDRVGFVQGKWALVDLKTGIDQPWHGPQTAAYARLMPHATGLKPERFALYLRSDATYRLEPFKDRNDENVFFAALTLAQFRSEHGYRD